MAKSETDKQANRMEQLLKAVLAVLKGGDGQAVLLALEEGLKAADSLPKKKQS